MFESRVNRFPAPSGKELQRRILALFAPVLAGVGVLSAFDARLTLALIFGAPVGLALVLLPEITLVLYLNAGSFKLDPRLRPLASLFDLTLLMAGVLLVAVLYRLILRKEKLIWTREASVAFVFSGLVLLSVLYTPAASFGLDKAFRFSVLTMLAFVAPLMLVRSTKSVWLFYATWFLIAAVFTSDAITKLGTGQRVSAFNATNIAMGRTLGVAILILLFSVLMANVPRIWQLLGVVGLALMSVALLAAGSRGPLLMLALTVPATVALASGRLQNQGRMLLVVVILALVLFITFAAGLVPQQAMERYTLLLNNAEADTSAQARLAVMRDAWELFVTRPLFGWGIGAVSAFGAGREQEYPHNILLELAAEMGLVGLGLYLTLFGMVFLRLLQKIGQRGNKQALWLTLIAILLFTMLNAMVSGDLNANRDLFMFSGLVIAAAEQDETASRQESAQESTERAGPAGSPIPGPAIFQRQPGAKRL